MCWTFLEEEIRGLQRSGVFREPVGAAGEGVGAVDVCSNDYLGYARSAVSRETILGAADAAVGAGASRLIHGTRTQHLALEEALAHWVHLPAALLFTSGFAANLGTISALAGPGDVIFSDALNHASIIDGCRLSRAHVVVVPHLDIAALEAAIARTPRDGRAWVVTETYFSMDGDSPDLPRLRQICTNHGALLIVDEAHALGVFGTEGSGLCSQASIQPDVLIGTLGKAIGCQGAFVAAPHLVRTWLWNRARSLVFSTAPSPLLATLTLCRVRRAQKDGASRLRLTRLAAYLRQRLAEAHVPVAPRSHGPIVPVILGDNERVVAAAARLARRGFLAQGIRPPTVPPGTARLRITVSANLQERHLDELAATLATECVR